MTELLPCPFCGSGIRDEVMVVEDSLSRYIFPFWVQCGICFSRGPCMRREDKAIEAWNKRTPPQETE